MSELPETFVPGFHDENEVRKMKYFKFGNTGMSVSQLSLGTGGFCLNYGQFTLEQCKATVHEAIKKGINYIDTAPWYGHGVSEEILGKCLEGIPRKAYYVATKVARYEQDPKLMFDFTAKKTRESIQVSLKKLGLDYVDILQVHDIEFAPSLDIVVNETLPVLKEAQDQGKTKFIGVTGYPVSVLADCIRRSSVKIDSVLYYTRLSMLNQTAKEFIPFFKSKNLGMVNAAAHCMGLLSSAGPPEWHPAPQNIKDVCTEARDYCKKNGVELGKLALYYALHEEGPHTNLVGMNTPDLLKLNLEVYSNGLTDKEKEVYDHVRNNILSKLQKTDWEKVEVARYWEAVKASRNMSGLPETFVPGFHDENEVRKMKYTKFGSTNMYVSHLSLGTAGFSDLFGEFDLEECKATVHEAIKRGINYLDTAPYYGQGVSEEVLGKCLVGIPRKAYYVATKIGRYEKDSKLVDYSAKKTRESLALSLKRLGLDYVDVLQIHSLEHVQSNELIFNETLPAMEELKKQGKTRYIGITAYPVSMLADYVKKTPIPIDTVLSFTRLSLLDQTLKECIPVFQSKNLAVINAAPHCVGLLTSSGPPPWQRAGQEIKDACAEAREYCKKNGVEIGKLALYYATQQEGPHTILVGMNSPKILQLNLEVYQNGITDKESKVYNYVNNIFSKLSKGHWE